MFHVANPPLVAAVCPITVKHQGLPKSCCKCELDESGFHCGPATDERPRRGIRRSQRWEVAGLAGLLPAWLLALRWNDMSRTQIECCEEGLEKEKSNHNVNVEATSKGGVGVGLARLILERCGPI